MAAVAPMGAVQHTCAYLGFAALLGVGTAFLWPACYAISADLYSPERRGKVVGFLNIFQLLGIGSGALAGAFLVERDQNLMFTIAVLAVAGGAITALLLVPVYQQVTPVYRRGFGIREVWSRQLAYLSGLVLMATAAIAMVVPALRPYAFDHLGVSLSTLTVALIPAVLVGAALYIPAGHIADRFGRMRPFFIGEMLMIVGALVIASTSTLYVAAAGGALVFAGNVFIVPAINSAVMDLAPETHRGTLIGLVVALTGLGLAAGPALGGVLAETYSPVTPFYALAAAAALVGAAVLAYDRRYGADLRPAEGVQAISRVDLAD
jgi:MFS family permease